MSLAVMERAGSGWRKTNTLDVPDSAAPAVINALLKKHDCTLPAPHRCKFPYNRCNATSVAIIKE